MPRINTDKQLQQVQRLGFCYFCGDGFTAEDGPQRRTRDHVPPRAVFRPIDLARAPLILPAHESCNGGNSDRDELVGQLASLLHRRPIRPENFRLSATLFLNEVEGDVAGLTGIELEETVWRWVRASHTALYSEFLPDDALGSIMPPFPTGRVQESVLTFEGAAPSMRELSFQLGANMRSGTVDELFAFTQKYRYACTWLTADDGSPFCIFGVRLYDWERMTDTRKFPERACLGWYQHARPPGASVGTNFGPMPIAWLNLNPFR